MDDLHLPSPDAFLSVESHRDSADRGVRSEEQGRGVPGVSADHQRLHSVVPEAMINLDRLLETNLVPDSLIRVGIRRLLAETLREKQLGGVEERQAALSAHIAGLKQSPVAVQTRDANVQHYEVPTRFYQLALGKRLKYSAGLWTTDVPDLDRAEERMLDLTCARAELENGQRIL